MKNIQTKSTSRTSALGGDIILRTTSTTRLIFRPEIVENPGNKEACVRGTFIFQKKKPSGNWEDYENLPLSKLKDGEWIKLEIHSGELQKLMEDLSEYKEVFMRHGIMLGETEFIITSENIRSALIQLSSLENKGVILEKLAELDSENLQNINSLVGITKLRNALKKWTDNKTNRNEEFWQQEFADNPWIIAQVFSMPVFIFEDKAYLGGKNVANTGGNLIDFLYKNDLTNNLVLIEIKTPTTSLIGNLYRGEEGKNGVYTTSQELSGSMVQILNYKDKLQKNYYNLANESSKKFHSFNPKCLIIIGSLENEELTHDQLKSLELFRSNGKDIEIITFDELFSKIEILLSLLDK